MHHLSDFMCADGTTPHPNDTTHHTNDTTHHTNDHFRVQMARKMNVVRRLQALACEHV